MYSVSRKNCEKSAALESSDARFEPASVRSRKIRSGRSGAGERSSITDEPDEQSAPRRRASAIVCALTPPVLARAGQRVDEQHQAAGDRERTGGVEVPVCEAATALTQQPRRHGEHERADGHVDEEDPRPAERRRRARRRAARRLRLRCRRPRPRCRARGSARGPPGTSSSGSRARPVTSIAAPSPWSARKHDQRCPPTTRPVEQRAGREEHEACDEDPAAPEQVGRRPPSRSTPPKRIA